MYRELLDDFLKIADEVSAEDLETLSEATLEGLDKLADIEIDKLEKFAAEEESLEKTAILGTLGVLGGLAAGGAAMHGFGALKKALPGWKADRAAANAANKYSKATRATVEYKAADAKANQARVDAGVGVKADGTDAAGAAGTGEKKKKWDDITNRVKMDNTNGEQLAGDIKAIKANDWLNKNKALVLAGAGGAALLANQAVKNDKKNAEINAMMGVTNGIRR